MEKVLNQAIEDAANLNKLVDDIKAARTGLSDLDALSRFTLKIVEHHNSVKKQAADAAKVSSDLTTELDIITKARAQIQEERGLHGTEKDVLVEK